MVLPAGSGRLPPEVILLTPVTEDDEDVVRRRGTTVIVEVPLRTWIQGETQRLESELQLVQQQQQQQQRLVAASGEIRSTEQEQDQSQSTITLLKNQSLIRQITVAFGAAELMRHASRLSRLYETTTTTTTTAAALPQTACNVVDNFNVHVEHRIPESNVGGYRRRRREQHQQAQCWNDVKGVRMLQPELLAQLLEPFFLIEDDSYDDDYAQLTLSTTNTNNATTSVGRYVEVDIYPPLPNDRRIVTNMNANDNDDDEAMFDERNECRAFGILLYEICAGVGTCPFQLSLQQQQQQQLAEQELTHYTGSAIHELEDTATTTTTTTTSTTLGPQRKRSTAVRYDKRKGKSYSTSYYAPLQELGFPSSISTLVQSLIDGHDTYMSLDAVCGDIQLLLSDPDCFLFDDLDRFVSHQGGSSMQPQVKIGKLYGREDEVSLVTDAFCRVSSGMNEALFIGGYSGSGKSMLVQSLKARIDIAGGYVLTQKCDEISKERPLLDVLHAFDKLCLLIRKKSSPQTLLEISNKLVNVFESDFSVLARLLPNINIVFPELAKPTEGTDGARDLQGMNLNNVCYTLQRFMRIVSSTLTPVMLFLDDLQWAGSTSLELIDALLSDKRGSTCFLFVGSYRDNEVQEGHPIFHLMSSLDSSGVPSTKLQLSGLNRKFLNIMISESLGILPHLCKPLGDIIFEKTEGNPYFALEFLRSLVDRRLLKYSLRERRWIWDESKIRSENITDNVLHLLVAKMTSLPDDVQSTLKIISCFGIKVDQAIVDYLCLDPRFSLLSDRLNKAVGESCIQNIDNGYKFIHDKVREAAYSLIPDDLKIQFHYDLGMLLYSISKGQGSNEGTFQIVDQINHGVPSLVQPEVGIEIALLNLKAGARAMEFSDYETASSYLSKAMTLLPQSHWRDHYDMSLRLYILSAKAAYLSDNIEQTRTLLKTILENGRTIGDKLDAYYLHVTILHNSEELDEAYFTCRQVLIDLNETIPDTIDSEKLTLMVKETGKLLENISEADIVEMKAMDSVLSLTLKFLSLLFNIAYFKNPDTTLYIGCKMIVLTLRHGMCEESVYSFIQYAATVCQKCRDTSGIQEACRIGKVAMSLMKRYSSPEIVPKIFSCYFGFVAVHTEPLPACADNLRRGFDVGISGAGAVNFAFFNSVFLVRNALLSGGNLFCLRNEIDYHLDVMNRFKHTLFQDPLLAFRETISQIIDKGQSITSEENRNAENFAFNSLNHQRNNVFTHFNTVLQSFWLGYADRCDHCAKRALKMKLLGSHNWLIVLFYAALNAFQLHTNGNRSRTQLSNLRQFYKDAITEMRSFATLSPSNYNGKVLLLEAEMHSFKNKADEAKTKYSAAVAAFRAARYVHEQGLACERAGFHYIRINKPETALDFFHQAKECYIQWGSDVKVDFITQQISRLTPKDTCKNV